jgi:ribose transport system substrate-binding protein
MSGGRERRATVERRRLIRAMAAAAAVLALVLAACGGDDDEEEPADEAAATTEQAAGNDYTIGVNLSLSSDPFFVAMEEGIKDEAKELGVRTIITYSSYDPSKQIADVQDFITQGVDGILISPADVEASVPAYEAARAEGIPVMSLADHSDPDVEDAFIGAPWDEFGARIAEWTCEEAGGEGKVAMIKGTAGVSFVEEMEDGYKEFMSSECTGMQIVSEVNTNFAREEAVKAAQDALTAHGDLKAIFAQIDDQAAGAAQAVAEAGKEDQVIITGFNGDEVGFEGVKDGSIDMTIALKPYHWARLALRTMVDHLNGKKAPKLVRIDSVLLDESNIEEVDLEDLR